MACVRHYDNNNNNNSNNGSMVLRLCRQHVAFPGKYYTCGVGARPSVVPGSVNRVKKHRIKIEINIFV